MLQETKIKISMSKKGQIPWNKGLKGVQFVSKETKKKLSIVKIGNKNAKGSVRTDEFKKNLSILNSGEKHWNWKGGISRDRHGDVRYRNWRDKIFKRDNWTCQECGKRGCYLESHHIKSFAHNPEIRYDLNNGITLCKECHKLTDNYKGKNNNYAFSGNDSNKEDSIPE